MNDVVKFEFEKKEVRSFWIDNEAWIVLSDICKILDLTKPSRVAQTLDDDEVKQILITDRMGRNQNAIAVNESGLYAVILRSNKPEAKKFRRWVTHEVLPSLRKTGSYSLSKAPEAELLREIQRLNEINERTNQKLDILIKQNEQKKARKQLPKEPLPDDEKAMIISAICDLAQKNQRVKAYYPEFRKYLVSKFGRDVLPVHAKGYLKALAPELKEKGIILQRIGENIKIPHTRESQRGFIICG